MISVCWAMMFRYQRPTAAFSAIATFWRLHETPKTHFPKPHYILPAYNTFVKIRAVRDATQPWWGWKNNAPSYAQRRSQTTFPAMPINKAWIAKERVQNPTFLNLLTRLCWFSTSLAKASYVSADVSFIKPQSNTVQLPSKSPTRLTIRQEIGIYVFLAFMYATIGRTRAWLTYDMSRVNKGPRLSRR